MELPKRRLGKTGVDVTIVGLGGEGILRTFGHEKESYALINKALDLGVTYCESARAYSGSESYYGRALGERRKEIFLASKSHARDRRGALLHLEETLRNMKTDHLDLWQIHDVRTELDIAEVFAPDGALEAFVKAREKGLTRFIGVTCHHDPHILKQFIERFDFDTVLIPVNPAEHSREGFLRAVLPLANEKGLGILGMKIYFRGLVSRLPSVTTLEPFYRFALSQPITTAVIGCDSLSHLVQNVTFAQHFKPMAKKEEAELIETLAPYSRQLTYYKP